MFEKLIDKLSQLNIKFSAWIIIGSVVITVLFSIFIKNLYFDNDLTNWVSENSELGRLPHYVAKKFGSNTPILLEFKFDDCFTYENLSLIREVSDDLEKMEGVDMVMSIANIDEISSSEGSVKVSKLLTYPLPREKGFYIKLKEKVLSKKEYNKVIISSDATTAMVIVKPRTDQRNDIIAAKVRKNVEKIMEGKKGVVYYGGLPSFMNSITEIVLKDFILLIPLVVLVVMGVLFYSFRTGRGILLPLLSVAFAALMAMGLMGLFRIPLNIMSVTIPVVLIACGNAYGIHVLNRYYEKAALFTDKKEIIRQVMREISLPVILSGLTAVFGFLSLATAQIRLVRDFGIYTGIGVFFATFISLMFIPSFLYKSKIQKSFRMKTAALKTVKIGRMANIFTNLVVKRSWLIITVFGIITVIGIIFSTKLISKVDYLAYFDKKSEPRVVADFTIDKFGGYFPYNIYIKADIKNPDVLKLLLITEEKMKFYTHLKPNGVADMITLLNQAMSGIKTIPETKAEVENLWFFVEGKSELDSVVTKDKTEALISCMVKSTDPAFINGLEAYLGNYLSHFSNKILSIENKPDNPELLNIERIFIGNLLYECGLKYSTNELDNIVLKIAEINKNYAPSINKNKLSQYLTGDESEIALTGQAAGKIISAIAGLKKFDPDSVLEALKKNMPENEKYDTEDIGALSRSLLGMINDESRMQRIGLMVSALKRIFPQSAFVPEEDLNYTVAPFVWKTIPSSFIQNTAAVNETPVQELGQTGYAYIAELLRREIIRDQVISLIITLLVVFIFNTLVFRSVKEGLISMIAMPFTLILNYGLMAFLKIPLDIVTVTIGSISIIGIDYTLHFIARYSIEMKKNGKNKTEAIRMTFATAGKAIIFNALSVGLGFAVLCFSSIIALRNLGFLLAMTMVVSCVTSLILLPALMALGNVLPENGNNAKPV